MELTQSFIDELINCPKRVREKPGNGFVTKHRALRKSFVLESIDGLWLFPCYGRMNNFFSEQFSFGLDFDPKDHKGIVKLLRCNGQHGGTILNPHHAHCHIHRYSEELAIQGLDPLRNHETTTAYTTVDEAERFFLSLVNVIKRDQDLYWPPTQTELFD